MEPARSIFEDFAMTALDLRRRMRRLALAAGLAGVALSTGQAHAAVASCRGADLVQSAAKSFVAASRTRNLAAFANAISRYVDVNGLALFALGPFRAQLPPSQD